MISNLISLIIIDDDDIDRLIIAKLSKKLGTDSIKDFQDPEEALKYLEDLPEQLWPTHIFVDINMPKMDGFQFIEAYSRLPKPPSGNNIFISIVTSSDLLDDRQKAKSYPCVQEFINKPVTLEKLQKIFDGNG